MRTRLEIYRQPGPLYHGALACHERQSVYGMESERWPYLCLPEEYSKNIICPWKIEWRLRVFLCIDWLNSC